jgi:hypothetical protein
VKVKVWRLTASGDRYSTLGIATLRHSTVTKGCSLVPLVIQKTHIESPFCVRHCARHWGFKEQGRQSLDHGVYSIKVQANIKQVTT